MPTIVMEDHDFYDGDVVKVAAPFSHRIELVLKEGTSAVLLSEFDVIAMAKHFGLSVFKKSDAL